MMLHAIGNGKKIVLLLASLVAALAVGGIFVYVNATSAQGICQANDIGHPLSLRAYSGPGSDTIGLTWDPPQLDCAGGDIDYRVQEKTGVNGTWMTIRDTAERSISVPMPEGRVTYRATARVDGLLGNRNAVIAYGSDLTIAPVPAPEEEAPQHADPPGKLVCFYQLGGELHTVSLPACSAEALAEVWDPEN